MAFPHWAGNGKGTHLVGETHFKIYNANIYKENNNYKHVNYQFIDENNIDDDDSEEEDKEMVKLGELMADMAIDEEKTEERNERQLEDL